jgi:hypothetical protein
VNVAAMVMLKTEIRRIGGALRRIVVIGEKTPPAIAKPQPRHAAAGEEFEKSQHRRARQGIGS